MTATLMQSTTMSQRNMVLGDAIHVRHGFAFKSQYFSDTGEFVVLTPGNFYEEGGFRLRPHKDKFYSAAIPQDYLLKKEALIVAMTEQGPGLLGSSALVPQGGKYLHNQRLGLVDEIDTNMLDKLFLYYLFNTRAVRAQLSGSATGTKVRHTAPERIYRVKVSVPSDVKVQFRIASILRAYDGLIGNNQRRIRFLKETARLLYEDWFVSFRFPGHGSTRITDGMPEQWERTTLGDVVTTLESGGRPKGGAVDKGVPSIGAENVAGIGEYDYSKEKYVPEEYFNAMRSGVIRDRDVVVYKDGANVGRSSYFGGGFPHARCAVNEHVFIARVLPEIGQNFLYYWISRDDTRQRIANLNANTAQPGVSREKLKRLAFTKPSGRLLCLFNEAVEPIVRLIFVLALQNRRLAQSRKALLPRLMSGEIAV